MKKDTGIKAIVGIAVASVVVIGASIAISTMNKDNQNDTPATVTPVPTIQVADGTTELKLDGASDKITSAHKNADGTYTIVVNETGYIGEMKIEVAYSADGTKVTGFKVLEHTETDGIGSKVTEDSYQSLLAGTSLPVYAEGMDISAILGLVEEDTEGTATYRDGVYEEVGEPASNGYVAHVTVTIEGGKITSVVWDEEKEGAWKSDLSEAGEYIMVEGNPIWKEQAESMSSYVVENQSTDGLNLNENGKTDVVSGVSISVDNFSNLVNNALAKASGNTVYTDGVYEVVGEPASNGYVAHVTVTIANGNITSVVWDEECEGAWKSDLSESGEYLMVEGNPIWKEQSEAMGTYVVEMQSTDGLNLNENGKTDVVSGVSISVNNFADLVNKALAMASGKAVLKDGTYEVVGEPASNGYIAFVTVTVEGGKIVSVTWDEAKDGEWKSTLSEEGKYVMVEGNPIWKEQSAAMSNYVVENQSTKGLNLNENGKTDVVSGVSISVDNFTSLINRAITQATEEVAGDVTENTTEQPEAKLDATLVEVVSGASYSSKAVIRAINEGYVFLRDNVVNK